MSRRAVSGSKLRLVKTVFGQVASVTSRRLLQLALVLGLCLAPTARAFEGVSPTPFAIEEDWEIVVAEPSPDEVLPQLYVVTTPTGSRDQDYAVFEVNNLLLPDFYGGGLQLQTWYGDDSTGEVHHDSFGAFATVGETVTFTVRMRAWGDGHVTYRVKNGQSTTWGAFGQSTTLRLVGDSGVTDLSGYDPEASARFSRVGFGRDRVTKFQIKQIRYYDQNNNLLSTDTTVRDAQTDEPI